MKLQGCVVVVCAVVFAGALGASPMDMREAVIVVEGGVSAREEAAIALLTGEVESRTGLRWEVSGDAVPAGAGPIVRIGVRGRADFGDIASEDGPGAAPEGYVVRTDRSGERPVITLLGADARGALFAAGHLLRTLDWAPAPDPALALPAPLDVETAPAYPIRGHQLGYRYHANTYDAWDADQYEQYIRDMIVFGANAFEQIPFQDDRESPHFPMTRREMNQRFSEICAKYGVEYWVWTPGDDLSDPEVYAELIALHEELYADAPRLDAVFYPGGDPGSNPPELVMPFLEDLSGRLAEHHPDAKIWLSLQGFDAPKTEFVMAYLDEDAPAWFGGIVSGPGSPPIPETRRRLRPDLPIRHYPDITHTVRAQYPVPWWDPAYNVTYGREPTNPSPARYAKIHNFFAPYTAGSISYSDGVNDDVNKVVWSRRGWNPDAPVREIMAEYARFFFGAEVAGEAADGILALERNWDGPLATNGGVDATLALWRQLDARAPHLADNWRWLLCLQRAEYDAYTRHRLLYEQGLEQEAKALLLEQAGEYPRAAMDAAWAVLARAETDRINADQYARIVALGDRLFDLIGMQTSVERHQASGTERGCILDLIHYPLFNRWWIEDEFARIREFEDEEAMTARLQTIATWERPGPGSFYDDIGNVAKMPRRIHGESYNTDPARQRSPSPGYLWWDGGYSRTKPAWQTYLNRTNGLRYQGLDPEAGYVLRITGYRAPIMIANGETLAAREDGVLEIGEFRHFEIPPHLYEDGELVLDWDRPDESHLNWREHSRLTEIWLLRE